MAGRAAELLSADINRGSRNLIFSTVITFAQILSRGNSVLFVIVAFIQNNAQHEDFMSCPQSMYGHLGPVDGETMLRSEIMDYLCPQETEKVASSIRVRR